MKRFLYIWVVFILGVFAGTFLGIVLLGAQVDTLQMENMLLEQKVQETEEQVQQLTAQPSRSIVSKIDSSIEFADSGHFDKFEKNAIELAVAKNIREWLKPLYGQKVAEVNYLLIPGIINRDILIEQTALTVSLKMVVISETISVWVEVQPTSASPKTDRQNA